MEIAKKSDQNLCSICHSTAASKNRYLTKKLTITSEQRIQKAMDYNYKFIDEQNKNKIMIDHKNTLLMMGFVSSDNPKNPALIDKHHIDNIISSTCNCSIQVHLHCLIYSSIYKVSLYCEKCKKLYNFRLNKQEHNCEEKSISILKCTFILLLMVILLIFSFLFFFRIEFQSKIIHWRYIIGIGFITLSFIVLYWSVLIIQKIRNSKPIRINISDDSSYNPLAEANYFNDYINFYEYFYQCSAFELINVKFDSILYIKFNKKSKKRIEKVLTNNRIMKEKIHTLNMNLDIKDKLQSPDNSKANGSNEQNEGVPTSLSNQLKIEKRPSKLTELNLGIIEEERTKRTKLNNGEELIMESESAILVTDNKFERVLSLKKNSSMIMLNENPTLRAKTKRNSEFLKKLSSDIMYVPTKNEKPILKMKKTKTNVNNFDESPTNDSPRKKKVKFI